ncbi:TPA: SEC10/PgrA surface exclusion domain-containing protein [Streptococcus suis]|uniref:SEC10/PgrA surface exclusion domain-containing protein n=1 Tax=Streptococcus suis TaxID=1307 RepID=UPI001478DD4F|nr:SEC10/PgrA surface exclusion domain-containing protein [Streptococcus suis]MDY7595901.1 SEC10/PgrA surface exclusion domain-containing protein [Streptococcus suis]HEL1580404.1 SEC10/PgrA surface exclusion domain-containing protein [Streptococcus suis]HEL1642141.1 SEC10/PgrA surface exclusion domain-containing protein [Streptococcus suis]HEL1657740.1 SEC10/PgrA surface exclusion domain-containing protein [Streptococcus suis]HEL1674124.1 SEC10/PgrA surface exclusion domain-containing protein 
MNKKTFKTLATGAAITLATVGASTVSADTQYGIFLNRVTGEWQTVNHATGEIVKSEPNGTYSSYEEAQASLATSTVETPVTTETPAVESTVAEAPKPAADVKPALDAQQAIVDATAQEATNAQADADAANQAVATAQADVDTATQAVKDAEANAANATPENIAANQADQAANLADQQANATETDQVNAEIADQTNKVADAQTAVDTAQAEKDQADATVVSKQADVKAAQDALAGTGLAEAQATLDQATTDVKTAQDNVASAATAVDTAIKADAERGTKIKDAQTDVAVKTDAVNTAKAKLTAAQDAVTRTDETLKSAQDRVTTLTNNQDKPVGHDQSAIISFTLQPQEMNTIRSGLYKRVDWNQSASETELANLDKEIVYADQLIKRAKTVFGEQRINLENNTIQIYADSEKEEWIDIRNISLEDAIEINEVAVRFLNDLRRQYATHTGATFTPTKLNIKIIENALKVAKEYMEKGDDNPDLHGGHDRTILTKYGFDNENIWSSELSFSTDTDALDGSNLTNFKKRQTRYHYTMAELKQKVIREIIDSVTNDAHSGWGHARHNVGQYEYTAVSFAVTPKTAMHMHTLSNFTGGEYYKPYDIENALVTNDAYITHLESLVPNGTTLTQAQAALTAAQTASDNAKAELTKASADYAKALELKTQAEKTLADATATPLQTQVAENNLRLAEIALQNAETRKADAQKAVDNFSVSLAEKKAALDTAQAELADAQTIASAKATALETAKTTLATEEATLATLVAERDALLAEKDRLVEEAKALAEELQGYLEAPAILANAQATLTEKQAALTEAQAKAETAQNKLETVTVKLAAEESKLAELQAEYDKLKDLDDKAKDNVIATLPDGTIVAVPKDAPTAIEKPAINIDAVKDAITKGQDVTVVDGEVVVTNPQAGVTVTPQGITYSRAERAKTLPNTGEQTSLALALLGLTNLLGVAVLRRNK